MNDLGLTTIRGVEREAKVPIDTLRHLLAGRTQTIHPEKAANIARVLNMPVEDLLSPDPHIVTAKPVGRRRSTPLVSAGAPDTPIGAAWLDQAAVDRFAPNCELLVWAVVAGAQMEPTIPANSIVLVDAAVTEFRDEGVYALAAAGGQSWAIRRIRIDLFGDSVIVSGDGESDEDTKIPRAEMDEKIKIAGRVIGVYRSI